MAVVFASPALAMFWSSVPRTRRPTDRELASPEQVGDLQQERDPRMRNLIPAMRADMERIDEAMGVSPHG